MNFGKVFAALQGKMKRKERNLEDLYAATAWFTGYSKEEIQEKESTKLSYGDFFLEAPKLNEDRKNIRGKICGVDIEEIENPLMQDIRRLDKMVDELYKGKSLESIFKKYEKKDQLHYRKEDIVSLDIPYMTCPGPLMVISKALYELPEGKILQVRATDPTFHKDIKNWCRSSGYTLLKTWSEEESLFALLC